MTPSRRPASLRDGGCVFGGKMSEIDRYISVVPTENQIMIEKLGFYCFVHFGLNTFTGKEWGDGKTPPSVFAPTELNTDQWCEVVASAGAKAVILTAKHHDGFCLWQTDTTEYCVKNSPWMDGKGDVVAMLADSCRKYGLKMGVYLSPWDRNSPAYGTDGYDDLYCAQLTELLTRYGDMFTVWLDGACGSHLDGKPAQKYDFERYYALIRRLQPNCAISNCGPDVRWVGNEAGVTRKSEWNVVPAGLADTARVALESQKEEGPFVKPPGAEDEDLGSREVLSRYDKLIWYPAEADVSIRPSWFYHSYEDRKVKSADRLLSLWYSTVGGNCMLLLNLPPDKRGLIHEKDARSMKELGERLDSAFARKIDIVKRNYPEADMTVAPTYTPAEKADVYRLEVVFGARAAIDKAVIAEDIRYSQRIEKFSLYAVADGKETKVYSGTTVGHKAVPLFDPTECDGLVFEIEQCRDKPYIEEFSVYASDGRQPEKPKFTEIKKFFLRLHYKAFLLWEKLGRKFSVKKAK